MTRSLVSASVPNSQDALVRILWDISPPPNQYIRSSAIATVLGRKPSVTGKRLGEPGDDRGQFTVPTVRPVLESLPRFLATTSVHPFRFSPPGRRHYCLLGTESVSLKWRNHRRATVTGAPEPIAYFPSAKSERPAPISTRTDRTAAGPATASPPSAPASAPPARRRAQFLRPPFGLRGRFRCAR